MAAPKTKTGSAKKPATEIDEDPDLIDSDEATTTELTGAGRVFLQRTGRFLVNVQSPKYLRRARREGYSAEEHRQGWNLWSQASGMTRPLEHWFGEQEQGTQVEGIADDRLRILRDLDAFENKWFPRVRAIIRRVVPKESRETFAAAFFKDLTQQPLGPGVVGSVAMLLDRIEALEKSEQPGAKDVLKTLRARRLTPKKIGEVRALLKEAKEAPAGAPKPAVSAEELATAQTAQLEALDALRDWFNDIGTMLRSEFGVRDQIVLGLTVVRPARGASEEDAEAGDEEEEDATAAPEAKPAKGKPA